MPAYFIRAEVLTGFLPLCTTLKIDASAILKYNQLSAKLIAEPDLLLPYEAVTGAMENASQISNRADFSSLLSSFQQPFPVGMPRPLMRHAPSIRQALISLTQHSHLHSSGIAWHLEESEHFVQLIRDDKMAGKLPSFQYAMLSLSHVVIAIRALLKKEQWKPHHFQFSYAEPSFEPRLKSLYGTRIHYDQDHTAVCFAREILDISLDPEEPSIRQIVQSKIRQIERQQQDHPQAGSGLIPQLEHWIRRHIHRDSCHLAALACQLDSHPKKLQRQLAAQGLNFRKLKADIRLDMAEHYLRDSNLSLTAISVLLGFGELSGFSRAFKHRHQCSPLQWREQHSST
jgi:AraC-like DNA-binding protein